MHQPSCAVLNASSSCSKSDDGVSRALAGYLVDFVVHLVGHLFELVVGHAEVTLVRVEVGILPAALGVSTVHVSGQVEG